MDKDVYFIRKTFQLAKRAEGFTSPNPIVGAVFVKNNKVVSSGYHKKSGFPHAEIEAIKGAKQSLADAQLYVNLEPCCHFGRTPPCVDEVIKTGIKRVVIAALDPNPRVRGKSVAKMKKSGIEVKVGVCAEEARCVNEVFFKNMENKRPFVVIKTAQSLDGKIAASKGVSKWITSARSRTFAKRLRDKYDAVLVGINTVVKDNPSLNGVRTVPYKVVIDPKLRMPLNSSLIRKDPDKLVIFTSVRKKNKKLPSVVKVFYLKEKKGQISVKEVLANLYNLGIMSVYVEGGGETIGRFFDAKLVDKVYFFIAPKIIGGKNALSSVRGVGAALPNKSFLLKGMQIKKLGEDILISGYPVKM
jgi:diaminohydroxyphosphoribosylaminopyrimidine deaminase/5-amino-6-(5-phosphoribosylamino)uracil reductase